MKNKGFTLLEMVVVVMIIGILFLLTIPNIQKVTTLVSEKGCKAQLKVVDSAILQYKLKNGQYPTSVNQLIIEGLISDEQKTCDDGKSISIIQGQAVSN